MPLNSNDTSPSTQYNWIDGVERLESYVAGGYHPIMVGDTVQDRYSIVDKLGSGGHSTVWLAFDNQMRHLVALKIGIADASSARKESRILRVLSEPLNRQSFSGIKTPANTLITIVLDEFELQGPNGIHSCYTYAPAQGDLKTASFCRLFPIRVARALSAGLTLAVLTVHSHGYIHGDIRLRNVLVSSPADFNTLSIEQFQDKFGQPETEDITRVDGQPLPPNIPPKAVSPVHLVKRAQDFNLEDARAILLADFGEAFSASKELRLGKDSHIPIPMRPPEAIFEPEIPLSYPSDVWSLALAIYDIVGMRHLFSESEPEYTVAAQQIDVLGMDSFPKEWWTHWQDLSQYFVRRHGTGEYIPAEGREVWSVLEKAFDEDVQHYRRKRQAAGTLEAEESQAFLDLMRRMLKFRPEERLTVEEVLQSDWMVKWALPEFG